MRRPILPRLIILPPLGLLIAATFLPFYVLHPVRTVRLRKLTLALIVLWGALLIYTLLNNFDVGAPVTVALCLIALYVVASDSAVRLLRSLKA